MLHFARPLKLESNGTVAPAKYAKVQMFFWIEYSNSLYELENQSTVKRQ